MHNTLFPKFALYRLRLLLELGARRQTLPAYLGSTVRGIFGVCPTFYTLGSSAS